MSPFSCPVMICVSKAFHTNEVTLGPFLGMGKFMMDLSEIF
jgi:hypothetical protein